MFPRPVTRTLEVWWKFTDATTPTSTSCVLWGLWIMEMLWYFAYFKWQVWWKKILRQFSPNCSKLNYLIVFVLCLKPNFPPCCYSNGQYSTNLWFAKAIWLLLFGNFWKLTLGKETISLYGSMFIWIKSTDMRKLRDFFFCTTVESFQPSFSHQAVQLISVRSLLQNKLLNLLHPGNIFFLF